MKKFLLIGIALLVVAISASAYAVRNTGEQIEDINGNASADFAPADVLLINLGTKGHANVSTVGKYAVAFKCYSGANRTATDCKYKFQAVTESPSSNYASAPSGIFKVGKNVTAAGFGAYSSASAVTLEVQTQ